jgi:hypothetical protein
MQGIEEAVGYIRELTEATNEGRMIWKSANPTTYVWETAAPTPARIIIQQVRESQRVGGAIRAARTHVLQVIDAKTGALRLSLATKDSPLVAQPLASLFEVASGGVTRAGLDFLKNVLPHK